ncbi:hypothetical protein [uncultured Litoreibacter sp.]|uniref:hypothetical protein n=1 Tax=uncultured Litoreibacter sp. TaxID=1392394 RepID=UPI002601E787|nr:hypothetical protein [uncultured Litoreibacter sp.]
MLSEIVTGLAAANQATQLVKELRSIDSSVDEASFKLKLAELTEALADTKVALSEAKLAIADKDGKLADLNQKLRAATSGETCPVCLSAPMKTMRVVPHRRMGDLGVQEKHLECTAEECDHSEKRMHDPIGILDKK